MMTDNEKDLISKIIKFKESRGRLDAIVVEGYDGVGKGRVLEVLSTYFGVTPYRPDYNFWKIFDLPQKERWMISGFFWDVYSHFDISSDHIMIFDRGVLSGAAYNKNSDIAIHYKKLLGSMSVLHVLVTCDKEDYMKFNISRNPELESNPSLLELMYEDYVLMTDRYYKVIDISGVDTIFYINKYSEDLSERQYTCKGCGHYNHGWCRHPVINCMIDGNQKRCQLSSDKEVQDIGSEMYSL